MHLSRLSPHLAVVAVFVVTAVAAHAQDPAPPASAPVAKSAPATPAEKAQAEIQAILDKKNAAAAKKDVASALRYLAPDFVGIASDGTKMNLAQVRAASQKTLDVAESVEIFDTIDTITLKGNTATLDMTETQKATVRQASGITHVLSVQSQSRCFWVKGKNGWQMKRSRVLQGGIDVDGKPVQVATPG